MKFLVKATIPVEAGNRLLSQPAEFFDLVTKILGDVRPEAFYFGSPTASETTTSW